MSSITPFLNSQTDLYENDYRHPNALPSVSKPSTHNYCQLSQKEIRELGELVVTTKCTLAASEAQNSAIHAKNNEQAAAEQAEVLEKHLQVHNDANKGMAAGALVGFVASIITPGGPIIGVLEVAGGAALGGIVVEVGHKIKDRIDKNKTQKEAKKLLVNTGR